MAAFRISRPAQADLATLLMISLARWGEGGRARYAALLAEAMRKIAAAPDGPTTRARADLAPGLRSYHIRHARRGHGVRMPVHVLYYRVAVDDSIEVVRVLHERMDPQRHVGKPARVARTRRPGRR